MAEHLVGPQQCTTPKCQEAHINTDCAVTHSSSGTLRDCIVVVAIRSRMGATNFIFKTPTHFRLISNVHIQDRCQLAYNKKYALATKQPLLNIVQLDITVA